MALEYYEMKKANYLETMVFLHWMNVTNQKTTSHTKGNIRGKLIPVHLIIASHQRCDF